MISMNRDSGRPFHESLVMEFFGESLSRIIPGLALLAMFEPTAIIKSYNIFHDSPFLFGIAFVMIAWLVGGILEAVSFLIPATVLRLINLNEPLNIDWLEAQRKKHAPKSLQWLCSKNVFQQIYKFLMPGTANYEHDRKHIIFTKSCGERVMFRGIAIICFVSFFHEPPLLSKLNFPWWRTAIAITFLASILAWLWAVFSRSKLEDYLNDEPKDKELPQLSERN